MRLTLQITRKETGKVETVEMVGFVDEAKLKELQRSGLLAQPQEIAHD